MVANKGHWVHRPRPKSGVRTERWDYLREGDTGGLYGSVSGNIKPAWREPNRFDAIARDFFVGTFDTVKEAKKALEDAVIGMPLMAERVEAIRMEHGWPEPLLKNSTPVVLAKSRRLAPKKGVPRVRKSTPTSLGGIR